MTFKERKQILDRNKEFVAFERMMKPLRGRAEEDVVFFHLFGCFPEDGPKTGLPTRQEFDLGDWQVIITLELLDETATTHAGDCA